MNPALLLTLVQAIHAAIAAAPQVVEVAEKAKDFIASLFRAELISKDQQDRIHAHVDAVAASLASGATPPEFTVEADPA